MKRNPGEWLRERLLQRLMQARLYGMVGFGWLQGAGIALWAAGVPDPVSTGVAATVLLPGAVFLGMALLGAKRGWRPADMRKGARAEERVGQAIEYALTAEPCAVAHHVEGIARIGDIDHLVATPCGLWVVETKHGRVPKRRFRETLRRIAANVAGVRDWAPGVRVTGCLVFASRPRKPPKPAYEWGPETIRCFADPESLMRELREEAHAGGGGPHMARKVWRLASRADG